MTQNVATQMRKAGAEEQSLTVRGVRILLFNLSGACYPGISLGDGLKPRWGPGGEQVVCVVFCVVLYFAFSRCFVASTRQGVTLERQAVSLMEAR